MNGPDGERLCSSCGESNPVRANFCLVCGTKFEDEAGDSGERRVLTVLFADLSGFTAFSEGSDVEDVRTLATQTADELGEIVVRYGGVVDKIIGDCVMAIFGAPVAHEDDPERAVRAALDMQACVKAKREKFFNLALCVGINTGEAIYSPVGPDGRYTVLGDTVNTAARLQGAANKGEIIVGAETHAASSDAIEYEEIEPVKAKNKAEPVQAWKALAVPGTEQRRRTALPLIGRTTESARLWELYENARTEATPYLASVVGAPGIGKSRLIRSLVDRASASGEVFIGRCLDYGEGITYWPVIEMVKAAAGVTHTDMSDAVSLKLGAFLESLGSDDLDELRTMAVALANLVAAPTTPRGTYSATEVTRGELHWGIRRVFHLLSRQKPVVLVFEDLHWADPALLELVRSFLDLESDAPILVIGSQRPDEERELTTEHRHHRTFMLEPLSAEESRAMLSALAGPGSDSLTDLLESAAGNPLFLEEMVRMLMDAGAIDGDGNVSHELVLDVKIPSGLRALIGARLDRLTSTQKRAAGRASVVGESFWTGAVAHLNGLDADAATTLAELEQRDVVQALERSMIGGEREWRFRHALLRDVSYERIPKAERARLHARCGEWIAGLTGGEDELVEIVAHHLEQACLNAREVTSAEPAPITEAVRALTRAAEKAGARQGSSEAARFYSRALGLLDDSFPERSTELELSRAVMLTGAGGYDDAYEDMRSAAERAESIGRKDLLCQALAGMTEIDLLFGRITEARQHLDRLKALSRELDDASLRVRAAWSEAVLFELYDASPDAAEEVLRGAVALAEEVEDEERMLTSYMRLGGFLFNVGKLRDAESEFERCAELAQARGSLRHLSWVKAFLGRVRMLRGPRDRAAEDLANAVEWLARTDDKYMWAQTLVWQGDLKMAMGDVRGAVRVLRIALSLARDIAGPLAVRASRSLIDAFARQSRTAEARELLEEAKELQLDEDPYAQADIAMSEAFLACAMSDETLARQGFAVALALLSKVEAKTDLGEAMLHYARALDGLGDAVGASDQLLEARPIFEEAGGDATVASIDETCARLSGEVAPVIPLSKRLAGRN